MSTSISTSMSMSTSTSMSISISTGDAAPRVGTQSTNGRGRHDATARRVLATRGIGSLRVTIIRAVSTARGNGWGHNDHPLPQRKAQRETQRLSTKQATRLRSMTTSAHARATLTLSLGSRGVRGDTVRGDAGRGDVAGRGDTATVVCRISVTSCCS
jgi:hypothetical protein